jgi:hypothetical protein
MIQSDDERFAVTLDEAPWRADAMVERLRAD